MPKRFNRSKFSKSLNVAPSPSSATSAGNALVHQWCRTLMTTLWPHLTGCPECRGLYLNRVWLESQGLVPSLRAIGNTETSTDLRAFGQSTTWSLSPESLAQALLLQQARLSPTRTGHTTARCSSSKPATCRSKRKHSKR